MKIYGEYFEEEDGIPKFQFYKYLFYYFKEIQQNYNVFVDNDNTISAELLLTPEQFIYKLLNKIAKVESSEELHSVESKFLINLFKNFAKDEKLDELQTNLEKIGIKCCVLNFYFLCAYIKELIKKRQYMLLKPQIQDTLSELKDVQSITFTNKDGSTSTSNSDVLIKTIIEALEAKKEETKNDYEADRIVSIDKITNKEVLQVCFINELSTFLHSYFKIDRKKDSVISTQEQKLIRYFMYLFELSPAIITDSRFRQLKGMIKKLHLQQTVSTFPFIRGGQKPIAMDFVKYPDWKSGKINLVDFDPNENTITKGDSILFSNSFQVNIE